MGGGGKGKLASKLLGPGSWRTSTTSRSRRKAREGRRTTATPSVAAVSGMLAVDRAWVWAVAGA